MNKKNFKRAQLIHDDVIVATKTKERDLVAIAKLKKTIRSSLIILNPKKMYLWVKTINVLV